MRNPPGTMSMESAGSGCCKDWTARRACKATCAKCPSSKGARPAAPVVPVAAVPHAEEGGDEARDADAEGRKEGVAGLHGEGLRAQGLAGRLHRTAAGDVGREYGLVEYGEALGNKG